MKRPDRIYLTGFMGSGKTTLGRRLAAVLNYRFVDLDAYIEKKHTRPIASLFAEESESAFRRLERDALAESFAWNLVVIAVGGGALVTDDAVEMALQKGLVVYLSASEATLFERIRQSTPSRPLFKNPSDATKLLAKRLPYYERAHISVSTDKGSVSALVEVVLNAISEFTAAD